MADRIDSKYLTGNHKPGEIILSEDMNQLEKVVKAGINANYNDIQKIQDGTLMVGNASQLQGATLSTYAESELTNDDNKFPSSRQVKEYIDKSDNTLNTNLRVYINEEDGKLRDALGASFDLSIDESTYVMTIRLKNSEGVVLSQGSVDLPLETMVVSASYDASTMEIVLTLQSGSTTRFSVASLVSGLQSEITSDNKLNSDFVDDTNQVNKFVTANEIIKLSGIETGAQVNIIEKVTVNGNELPVSGKDVRLTIPTKVSDLENDSEFVPKDTTELINYVTSAVLSTLLGGKQDTLISGINLKTINNYSLLGEGNVTIETEAGLSNYDELNNRPQINSHVLTGNQSSSDLGLQPAGDYLTEETEPAFNSSAAANITSNDITNWDNKGTYSKPESGIPKIDLTDAVQTSLGLADTALQSHQDISGKEDILNKAQTITDSTVNYPSTNAVKTYVDKYISLGNIITLEVTNWALNEESGNYEYTVIDEAVTENTFVIITLDIENQKKLEGYAELRSYDGYYTISTDELPTEDVTGHVTYTIVNGVITEDTPEQEPEGGEE